MKKILAFIMSLSILALAGCSKTNDNAAQEGTDLTDASVSEEPMAEAIEQTEADVQTEAETEISAEETVSETSSEANAAISGEASCLTAAVIEKASEWKDGNIIVSLSYEKEGMSTIMEINSFEKNALVHIDIVGLFSTKNIMADGKTYMINDDSRSYSVSDTTEEDEQQADSYQDYLIDEEEAMVPTETGKETIDGKEYSFETFDSDDKIVTYYFDDNKDMRYCSTEVNGEKEIVNFTISMLDEPDLSVFEIPADYTEVSAEEMAMLMFGNMFASMEEIAEDGKTTAE